MLPWYISIRPRIIQPILQLKQLAGASKQFYAVGDKGYLSLDSISETYSGQNNPNLRQKVAADSLDLIIVTAPDFLTQADQLGNFQIEFRRIEDHGGYNHGYI